MKAALLLLLLPACALHANAPLFTDDEATPALGAAALTLTDSRTSLALTPQGRHYTTPDAHDYSFIPLPSGGYILQTSTGTGADYALATWDGTTLQSRPLDCARLKTELRTNPLVQFSDNACRLRPEADPIAAFTTMAEVAGPATLSLTRQ